MIFPECVHLDMKDCPYNKFDSGFTIGLWFKTNVSSCGMSLLKKTSFDGLVNMEITVNMSKFSLLLNKKRISEVSCKVVIVITIFACWKYFT